MVSGGDGGSVKKRITPAVQKTDGHLRDIYASFFKAFYKLPYEIGRMKPRMVFSLLDALAENTPPTAAAVPPHLRAFYGLD